MIRIISIMHNKNSHRFFHTSTILLSPKDVLEQYKRSLRDKFKNDKEFDEWCNEATDTEKYPKIDKVSVENLTEDEIKKELVKAVKDQQAIVKDAVQGIQKSEGNERLIDNVYKYSLSKAMKAEDQSKVTDTLIRSDATELLGYKMWAHNFPDVPFTNILKELARKSLISINTIEKFDKGFKTLSQEQKDGVPREVEVRHAINAEKENIKCNNIIANNILQLIENKRILNDTLKQKGVSIMDDFANVSNESPSYTDGDD